MWAVAAAVAIGACGGGGSDDADLASSAATSTSAEVTTKTGVEVTTSTLAATTATTTTRPVVTTTRPAAVAATAPPATQAPATAPPAPAAPKAATLTIQNFAFSPAALQIGTNTRVTATNKDAANHTWTADSGQWSSGSLGLNGTFSHTFTTPGTYSYRCDIHPSMKGTVTVS